MNVMAELFQVFPVNSNTGRDFEFLQEPVSDEAILIMYTFIEGGKEWSQSSQLLLVSEYRILGKLTKF